jgi:hypothetical protein
VEAEDLGVRAEGVAVDGAVVAEPAWVVDAVAGDMAVAGATAVVGAMGVAETPAARAARVAHTAIAVGQPRARCCCRQCCASMRRRAW